MTSGHQSPAGPTFATANVNRQSGRFGKDNAKFRPGPIPNSSWSGDQAHTIHSPAFASQASAKLTG